MLKNISVMCVLVGIVALPTTVGSASMTGLTSVTIAANAGVATVRGFLGVDLSGPIFGPDVGPILCAGSIDPLSGLPFGTFGIGAKGHNVTP